MTDSRTTYRPDSSLGGWILTGPRYREDLRDGAVVVVARSAERGGSWLRLVWRPTRYVWFARPGEPSTVPDGTWHVTAYRTKREAIADAADKPRPQAEPAPVAVPDEPELAPPTKPTRDMSEAELLARRDELAAALAPLSPTATARHDIGEQLKRVDACLEIFESVRVFGFAVGAAVEVLPASWDESPEPRRGTVVRVEVEHARTYFGREPITHHRRAIAFADGGEQLRPTVDRLRAINTEK